MSDTQTLLRQFDDIAENVILLEKSVTEPICEGLSKAYASFQALCLQYQKHHFVVEGSEFYMLHNYFQDSFEATQGHAHDLGERLHGLGGTPAASFSTLANLCCFAPEGDSVYRCRQMIANDLQAEQALITLIRQQASLADSLGDRATRYLYEGVLLKTEERAYHLEHFLTPDSLKLGW